VTPHGDGNRACTAVPGAEWSVGDLAAVAAVTVRTLHHYDRLGLVRASRRTSAGHRRYSIDNVHRLYRVLALRHLGLGLDRVRDVLAGDAPDALETTVRQQLAHVDTQLRDLTELRSRLARLVTGLAEPARGAPAPGAIDDLLEAIDVTVHLTRIYTRTGDDGTTGLGDKSRASKTSPRVEALGAIDELNAHLGAALATGDVPQLYAVWLVQVQNDLFDAGADVSVPSTSRDGLRLDAGYTHRLEQHCDEANEQLAPLQSFVLPGGTKAAAQLHVSRTVCRRAERRVLALDGVNADVSRYLNRLSDLLFILARAVGADEALWDPAAGAAAG
jgi:cob(I)alamin adenosyltransferase